MSKLLKKKEKAEKGAKKSVPPAHEQSPVPNPLGETDEKEASQVHRSASDAAVYYSKSRSASGRSSVSGSTSGSEGQRDDLEAVDGASGGGEGKEKKKRHRPAFLRKLMGDGDKKSASAQQHLPPGTQAIPEDEELECGEEGSRKSASSQHHLPPGAEAIPEEVFSEELECEECGEEVEAQMIEWKEELEADLKKQFKTDYEQRLEAAKTSYVEGIEAEKLKWKEEMEADVKKQLDTDYEQRSEAAKTSFEADKLKWEQEMEARFEERLKEEKEKMATQHNSKIKEIEDRHTLFRRSKAKELQRKDSEKKSLEEKVAKLAEVEGALEEMRQTVVHHSKQESSHKHQVTHLQERHDKDIENLKNEHHQRLWQLEEELIRQMEEEGEKKAADLEQRVREAEGERDRLDAELKAAIQEKDTARTELERVSQDIQGVQMEKEELEKKLQEAVNQEQEARRVVDELNQNWMQKYEELQNEHKRLQEVKGQPKVEELECQLKDKEEAIIALRGEMETKQLQPQLDSVSPPPPDLRTLRELEHRCRELESENQKLRVQRGHPIPSNVYHFCLQLSQLVDPEGDSAETTSRPLLIENVLPILQAMGCGLEYKPRGYVIALFNAFNQTQSVLLDYTRIGEVVTLKGPNEHLGASDPGEEIEKSPFSSLEGVKITVTDGNMTDTDKLDVQQLLAESQEQLEKLRVENKDLLERLNDMKEVAEVAVQTDTTDREEKAFKDLKAKYLQIHDDKLQLLEKLKETEAQLEQFRGQNLDRGDELPAEQWHAEKQQLLEKLEERDAQLKQFREQNLESGEGPPTNHHNVERSLSLDDIISPEDPKAEVIRLRKVLKGKEEEIRNLGAQVKSFEAVAGTNVEEIAQLKKQLEAAQAEIKKLSDRSELVQVYNSLRAEVAVAREDLKKSESEKQDLEVERDVWESDFSAERDNNQNFQSEIARLKAALHFYEMRYPQADTENILDDSEQSDRELVERMKTENADLQAKIRQKEAVVTSLTKSRSTVETRFLRLQEERDRLAEQIVTLTAVRANLKGELSRCDEVKRNTDKFASQLQHDVLTKINEAESWQKEKEMIIQEIQTLQNDLEARKQEVKDLRDELEARKQEVAIVREDFKLELEQSKAGKWRAQERKYQEDLRNQDLRLKHLTHESGQRVMKLTIKLEDKTAECDRVLENAYQLQREADEQCDQLRQERDSMRMDRDRYKEEREVLSAEFNRMATMYDEKKLMHKAELREKQEQCDSLQETVEVLNVKYSSLEDCMRKMEEEAMKKEKQFELTASNNRQLENKLQEVSVLLTKERQAKEHFSAKLNALDHRRQHDHDKWQGEKCELERAISELSEQVQKLQQFQTQTEVLRRRFQDENKKVIQLQRELQCAQDKLQSKDEEHKTHVELIKAQCENDKLDQERLIIPLRRELEQLRSQKFSGEGQFSETYRRMDAERKELRKELETLEAKYSTMTDGFTAARELLIQNGLPLPKRKADGQYDVQRQPSQVPPSMYPAHAVRPYMGPPQSNYPPTSSESRNYGPSFRHLGDNRPQGYPRAGDNEMRPEERSIRTLPVSQPSNAFSNLPRENFQQKPISKSGYMDKQGGVDYGMKQRNVGRGQEPQKQQYDNLQQQIGGVGQNSAYNQRQQNIPMTNVSGQPYQHPQHQPPHSPNLQQPPTNAQSRDPAMPAPGHRQEQQYYPPPTNAQPQGNRPLNPSAPQENLLMKDIDADISEAAADVRREVFSSMSSVEGTPGSEDPMSLPLDSNLVCPMCKRQFRIGQIQHYRSHVDSCQGR